MRGLLPPSAFYSFVGCTVGVLEAQVSRLVLGRNNATRASYARDLATTIVRQASYGAKSSIDKVNTLASVLRPLAVAKHTD